MDEKIIAYRIPEIPDSLYPQYQIAAGGDVLAATGDDCEHLLRAVADLPPESASVNIRYTFDPRPPNGNMQDRLGIYVMARHQDKDLGNSLRLLFERGPLTRFYRLQRVERFEAPWVELQAACEILRREDAVEPLHSSEFNFRIPEYYYTIGPFKPNSRNDYVNLDRVLGGIGERVVVDMRVGPTDVSNELRDHTRYLSRLQSINRAWDSDQDDEPGAQDYLDDSRDWRSTREQGLKPLRHTDPLADEIFRFLRGFHESLRRPHLLFRIIVFAQTPAVARLVGSVVADSGFQEGSYRLLTWSKGMKYFDEGLRSVKESRVSALPVHEFLFRGRDTTLYSDLGRLSHLATVDELLGVFRLPVSSASSLHCIRKNTDPPHEKDDDIIIIGYDQENPGLARGPRVSSLVKHMFVTGTPGTGKTTSILGLLIQLWKNNESISHFCSPSTRKESLLASEEIKDQCG